MTQLILVYNQSKNYRTYVSSVFYRCIIANNNNYAMNTRTTTRVVRASLLKMKHIITTRFTYLRLYLFR